MAAQFLRRCAMQSRKNATCPTSNSPEKHSHNAPLVEKSNSADNVVEDGGLRPEPRQSWFQSNFGGLRRTLRVFLSVAIVVLIVNLSWLIYASTHYNGLTSGYGMIQQGDCNDAKSTDTWLHLLINILSTLLLTGSNSFMATYCCPSRKEIDKAHARRSWLHIGVLSLRNLGKIAKRKSLVVLILGLSSLPFHLLYNSLIFQSVRVNNYYFTIVTPTFLTGAHYNLTGPMRTCGPSQRPCWSITPQPPDGSIPPLKGNEQEAAEELYAYYDNIQNNAMSWEKRSNRECLQDYSNAFLTERRNVLLVSGKTNTTEPIPIRKPGSPAYTMTHVGDSNLRSNWWICSKMYGSAENSCQPSEYLPNAESWTVYDYPIDYCLSERVDEVCAVEFSLSIMIVVILCNAIKVLTMIWVLLRYNSENLLTSVGDSIGSFLEREDVTTKGICLAEWCEITKIWRQQGTATIYKPLRRYWARSISIGKWVIFIVLMLTSLGLIAYFGGLGFKNTQKRGVSLSFASLWDFGFKRAHQDAIIFKEGTKNTISMAFLANIPQLFLAAVWLAYANTLTSMFLAADWTKFGTAAGGQALMVVSPRGDQRGTWMFGAPWAYALPILMLQIILHWLVSQSIFVVSVDVFNPDGLPDQNERRISTCGYSPIAIIFTLIALGLLILSVVVLASRRFPEGAPPLVATCSAAISAACHLPDDLKRHGMVFGYLRWGQCEDAGENGVGHCALMPQERFETGDARAPTVGNLYD